MIQTKKNPSDKQGHVVVDEDGKKGEAIEPVTVPGKHVPDSVSDTQPPPASATGSDDDASSADGEKSTEVAPTSAQEALHDHPHLPDPEIDATKYKTKHGYTIYKSDKNTKQLDLCACIPSTAKRVSGLVVDAENTPYSISNEYIVKNSTEGHRIYLPANYGEVCGLWDLHFNPECKTDFPPSFCTQPWCYVDKACKANDVQPSFFFKDQSISYANCGGFDAFTATACLKNEDEGSCIAKENCAWNEFGGVNESGESAEKQLEENVEELKEKSGEEKPEVNTSLKVDASENLPAGATNFALHGHNVKNIAHGHPDSDYETITERVIIHGRRHRVKRKVLKDKNLLKSKHEHFKNNFQKNLVFLATSRRLAASAHAKKAASTTQKFWGSDTKAICQSKECQCLGAELADTYFDDTFGKDYGKYCNSWDQDSCGYWADHNQMKNSLGLWCCKRWCYVSESCPTARPSTDVEGLFYSYYSCQDDVDELDTCPWKRPIDFEGNIIPLTVDEARMIEGGMNDVGVTKTVPAEKKQAPESDKKRDPEDLHFTSGYTTKELAFWVGSGIVLLVLVVYVRRRFSPAAE